MKKLILSTLIAISLLTASEAKTIKPKPTPVPVAAPQPVSALLNEASGELTTLENDLDKADAANKSTQASLTATTLQLSTGTTKNAQLQVQIDNQTVALNKATAEAVYWHAEQIKALKALWWWRGVAITIASVIAAIGGLYIAVKFGWLAAL